MYQSSQTAASKRVRSVVLRVQVLKVLEGHTKFVLAVAVSTDGTKIVSGSDDTTVRVWSMETGEVPPACRIA